MADQGRNTVHLGCGTLILIALIVLIFSGSDETRNLKGEIETLHEEVKVLQDKVDALARVIEAGHASSLADKPLADKVPRVPEEPSDQ